MYHSQRATRHCRPVSDVRVPEAEPACIGAVADDLNGREIVAELEKEGIDASHFQIFTDGDFTAYSVILVDLSGERSILSYKGEGQHFDVSKIPFEKSLDLAFATCGI